MSSIDLPHLSLRKKLTFGDDQEVSFRSLARRSLRRRFSVDLSTETLFQSFDDFKFYGAFGDMRQKLDCTSEIRLSSLDFLRILTSSFRFLCVYSRFVSCPLSNRA